MFILFKELISAVKDTVAVVATITTVILGIWGFNQKAEKERFESNLYQRTEQWTDEKGRLVTEVTKLTYSNSELKKISNADSSKLSAAEKKLYVAAKEIEELRIKHKDVESYNKADFEVKNDSLKTIIVYDKDSVLKELKPIKTDHLTLDFKVDGDTLTVSHTYKASIITVVNRKVDMYTASGKKRFILARVVNPRYEYFATNRIDDPNAAVTSDIYIEFQNKKGKRN